MNETKIRTIEYAKKWFELNGYTLCDMNKYTNGDRESLCLLIDSHYFELSDEDIYYRAELYLESEMEGLRCTRV